MRNKLNFGSARTDIKPPYHRQSSNSHNSLLSLPQFTQALTKAIRCLWTPDGSNHSHQVRVVLACVRMYR